MGLFSPPPQVAPAPPSDGFADGAAACIMLCAVLCIYNAVRVSDHPPSGLAYQLVGFLVNVISVSIPGRFDSDVDPKSMSFPWPTLFSPAGFAFAIWGLIYIGEFAGMAVLMTNHGAAAMAAPASRAWLCANIAQALWCASFRPWALDRLWLSSACLAATATSLVVSQMRLVGDATAPSLAMGTKGPRDALLMALVAYPRSLHAGWVTAATLVNINAWAGKAALGPARGLAVFVLSLVLAAQLATLYASRGLLLATAAIAWALFAVSKGAPTGKDALTLGPTVLDGLASASAATAGFALVVVLGSMVMGSSRR